MRPVANFQQRVSLSPDHTWRKKRLTAYLVEGLCYSGQDTIFNKVIRLGFNVGALGSLAYGQLVKRDRPRTQTSAGKSLGECSSCSREIQRGQRLQGLPSQSHWSASRAMHLIDCCELEDAMQHCRAADQYIIRDLTAWLICAPLRSTT